MENNVNYTAIGLFVCVLGFALVAMILWVGKLHERQTYVRYIVYMEEAVSGLNVQAPVKFNGVDVGTVEELRLDPINPQRVMLILRVYENTPVMTSTVAKLEAQGITGLRYVALRNTTPSRTRLTAKPGQRYAVIPSEPSLLVRLDAVVQNASENFEQLSKNINSLLSRKNLDSLTESLADLQLFTKTLADNSQQMDATLKYTLRLSKNTAMASEQLPRLTKNFETTLTNIDKSAQHVQSAAQQITRTMQEGQVLAQGFNQQVLPRTANSLEQFQQLLQQLDQFSGQLTQDPSVLLRGVKPLPPGPGEEAPS